MTESINLRDAREQQPSKPAGPEKIYRPARVAIPAESPTTEEALKGLDALMPGTDSQKIDLNSPFQMNQLANEFGKSFRAGERNTFLATYENPGITEAIKVQKLSLLIQQVMNKSPGATTLKDFSKLYAGIKLNSTKP